MNPSDIDPNDYYYKPTSIQLKWHIRWHIFWSGLINRGNTLKKFCSDNGINYPPEKGHRYVLPSSYMLESEEIKYLGKVRDGIVLTQHDDYLEKQKDVSERINEVTSRVEEYEKIIKAEQESLEHIRAMLKKSSTPSDIISLENREKTQNTKIKNLSQEKAEWKNKLVALMDIFKKNTISWEKQLEITCGIIDVQSNKYLLSVTKKIQNKLNFTNFTYKRPLFGKNVEKIISEEEKNEFKN